MRDIGSQDIFYSKCLPCQVMKCKSWPTFLSAGWIYPLCDFHLLRLHRIVCVGTLLATKIPWRDSIRFHEGHLSIKFHPLGMKWCSNLFSFQLRSRAFATPCSSSDAPKCIALIGPRRIDHVFVTFRGSSNRQCSATKVVLRLHSLCQEISPYSSNVLQKQESFRIPSVSGILTVLTVLTK